MEKIQDKVLTASAWIWQSYRATTIWQRLVVSWDTAGALWASGNDASTPETMPELSVIIWWRLCWNQCSCTNISYSLFPTIYQTRIMVSQQINEKVNFLLYTRYYNILQFFYAFTHIHIHKHTHTSIHMRVNVHTHTYSHTHTHKREGCF